MDFTPFWLGILVALGLPLLLLVIGEQVAIRLAKHARERRAQKDEPQE